MKTIAFAWTTAALLAGAKTVTRRAWKPEYAARWKAGDFALAYNNSPRAGGKPLALIRLAAAPSFEPLAEMPESEFEAEGYRWMGDQIEAHPDGKHLLSGPNLKREDAIEIAARGLTNPERARACFEAWRGSGGSMWVIRFELVSRFDGPRPAWAVTLGWPKRAAWLVEQAQGLGESFCRVCFCRDTAACPARCAWVEVDRKKGYGLCSSCAERIAAHPSTRRLAQGDSSLRSESAGSH